MTSADLGTTDAQNAPISRCETHSGLCDRLAYASWPVGSVDRSHDRKAADKVKPPIPQAREYPADLARSSCRPRATWLWRQIRIICPPPFYYTWGRSYSA